MAQDSRNDSSAPELPPLLHGQQLLIFPIPGWVREAKRIPSPRSHKNQPGMAGRMDKEQRKGSVGSGSPEAVKEQIAED